MLLRDHYCSHLKLKLGIYFGIIVNRDNVDSTNRKTQRCQLSSGSTFIGILAKQQSQLRILQSDWLTAQTKMAAPRLSYGTEHFRAKVMNLLIFYKILDINRTLMESVHLGDIEE